MRILFSCLIVTGFCGGCATSLLETRMVKQFSFDERVINNFADAMKEDNEPALRRAVSLRFEQKALRTPTAFAELEILNLPKDKLTVVETEELDGGARNVIVSDPDGTKYQFKLTRDPDKRRWVVDDVVSRQQKKGTRAARSSTEVMDLLLTLREFLATWENGSREEMLNVVSVDLRGTLAELPEPWLRQLIRRVTSEYEAGMARRPEAQISEADAVVKVPARSGFLLMKIAREGDGWLVSDVEVHSRKVQDHPGSIRRQADALKSVTGFLHGYETRNHDELRLTTTEQFYQGSLQFGDLSLVALPSPEHAPDDFEIRAFSGQLTVMIPDTSSVVRIDLMEPDAPSTGSDDQTPEETAKESGSRFVIREVTVYDRQTEQQRNLSSAFTAPTRAMLFMSLLEERNLPMLQQISSSDFSKDTWSRLTPELVGRLPLGGVPTGELTLLNSRVRGTRTELEFRAASGQLLNVLLSEENGYLRVDDVQYPNAAAEIVSLKTQLELVTPVIGLADAWSRYDVQGVRDACSRDFNRLVWANRNSLPVEFVMLPKLLGSSVHRTRVTQHTATVTLNAVDGRFARLQLLSESGRWMVDEISFVGPGNETVDIRASLRHDIAQQILAHPPGTIQQASATQFSLTDSSESRQGVIHAHAEFNTPRQGNLTLPSTKPVTGQAAGVSQTQTRTAADMKPDSDGTALTEPSAGPEPGVTPARDGLLRFGPAADQQQPRPSSAARPNHSNSSVISGESASYDGVVYFLPRDSTAPPQALGNNRSPNESAEPDTGLSSSTTHNPDPASRPIEIPLK